MTFKGIVSGAISPVTKALGKREDRKAVVAKAQSALEIAKAEGSAKVELSENELRRTIVKAQSNDWKDDAIITVFVTPVVMLIAGAFYSPLMDKAKEVLAVLDSINYTSGVGLIIFMCVSVALGIKTLR